MELNHPFVPSKFFIKKLFTGKVLPHALHAHHRTIFSHDLKTVYGVIIQNEREEEILKQSAAMSELSVEETTMKPPHQHSEYASMNDDPKSKLQRLLKGGKVEGDPELKAMELENPRPTEGQPCGNAQLDKSERFLEMCGELLESGKIRKKPEIREDGEEEEQTGGALFTYVVTTDGQMRWSEVGAGWAREVGSKHVILSNGAKHVAFAGEFFVRRKPKKHGRRPSYSYSRSASSTSTLLNYRNIKNRDEKRDQASADSSYMTKEHMLGDSLSQSNRNSLSDNTGAWSRSTSQYSSGYGNESTTVSERDRDLELMFPDPMQKLQGVSDITLNTADQVKFQLYIDNDSGTYRPPEKNIPIFREFLKKQFPGIEIIVSHCAGEEGKKIERMKQAHVRKGRERGEVAGEPGDAVEGGDLVLSDSSSSSSSDDEHDPEYAERSGMNRGGKLPSGVQEFAEKYGIRMM